MNTTPEMLRHALLLILDTNRTPFGLNVKALQLRLRMTDIAAEEAEITTELEYLAGRIHKALVAEVRPEINRKIRVWKITEEGIDYVDQHNL
jgi:hypothetical protein